MEKIHRHFEEDIAQLQERMLRLGGVADNAVALATSAFIKRDADLAKSIIENDEDADRLELEIDHLCLEMLARHAPMAGDLRFVSTVMRVTPELERVADLAAQVCERTLELVAEPPLNTVIDVLAMSDQVRTMLRGAFDAFVQRDGQLARAVIAMDDDLDRRMDHSFRILLTLMLEDAKTITRALRLLMVAKYYERMGDQVTNIAEQVVYLAEGRMIKHMGDAGLEDTGES